MLLEKFVLKRRECLVRHSSHGAQRKRQIFINIQLALLILSIIVLVERFMLVRVNESLRNQEVSPQMI